MTSIQSLERWRRVWRPSPKLTMLSLTKMVDRFRYAKKLLSHSKIIRIRHTIVLYDPYDDPTGFEAPSRSPSPDLRPIPGLLPEDINIKVEAEMSKEDQEKLKAEIEEQQARARAQVLVNLGDIPDVDIKPPENVLFVCRLNPITTEDDLLIIFGKYGEITDCEIIKVCLYLGQCSHP